MLSIPPIIEPLFVAAGWDPATQLSQPRKAFPSSQLQVAEILRRFGGMRVGQSGPGTEQAASDICFYSSLRPEVDVVISPWLPKVGKCAAFGTAHNHHMILFVNDEGTYFAITDPDERLYKLDGAFGQVMQNLLCGYRFGAPLAREA